MTRAILYLRQSLDRADNHLGIDRQLEECSRLCASRGWNVAQVVTENNVSASRGPRPGYQEAIRLVRAGEADVIVVLKLDRLLRKLTELEELIDLGIQVVTVQGDIDLTNASGRLVGRILASVARGEMETKSERHKLANRQKAVAGKPHGSRRPYGYKKDLVTIHEPEAVVLRTMAQKLINGWSYKEIAYWLNENNHTTTLGRLWYPVTVRNMIRKKRYAGIREYEGAEYPAVWQPVFDPVTWERLNLTIRLRREGASQPETPLARKYLLTGLLHCGKCGQPLNGSTKRDRADTPLRRVYLCRIQGDTQRQGGCGGVRRNAEAVDDYVRELVFYRLDTPELAWLLSTGDDSDDRLRGLLDARKEQQLRIDALVDDYATGLLTRQQLARAKSKAEDELGRLQHEIDVLSKHRGTNGLVPAGQSVREAWDKSGSDEWRRNLLGLLIKRVDVKVGKTKPRYVLHDGTVAKFDPQLIEIEWIA